MGFKYGLLIIDRFYFGVFLMPFLIFIIKQKTVRDKVRGVFKFRIVKLSENYQKYQYLIDEFSLGLFLFPPGKVICSAYKG